MSSISGDPKKVGLSISYNPLLEAKPSLRSSMSQPASGGNQTGSLDQVIPKVALATIKEANSETGLSVTPRVKRGRAKSDPHQPSHSVAPLSPRSPEEPSEKAKAKTKKKISQISFFKGKKKLEGINWDHFLSWQADLIHKTQKPIVRWTLSYLQLLSGKETFNYFFHLIDKIENAVLEEVFHNEKMLEEITPYLTSCESLKKVSGNLENLLGCKTLRQFIAAFNSLSMDHRKIVIEQMGSEEFILFLDKWEEQKASVRKEIIDLARELTNITEFFNEKKLQLPVSIELKEIRNEQVQRNWFPSDVCLVDEVYFNGSLIQFESLSPTATREEQKACLRQNIRHLIDSLQLSPNPEKEAENIISNPSAICKLTELVMQTIEIATPIVYALRSNLNDGQGQSKFFFRSVHTTCHYETTKSKWKLIQTKTYHLFIKDEAIGSFDLTCIFFLEDKSSNIAVSYDYTINWGNVSLP